MKLIDVILSAALHGSSNMDSLVLIHYWVFEKYCHGYEKVLSLLIPHSIDLSQLIQFSYSVIMNWSLSGCDR